MPYIPDSPLDVAFRSLADLCDDFQQANYGSGQNVLERIVALFDEEPLAGFIHNRLPYVDYDAWLATIDNRRTSFVGGGAIRWPVPLTEKIAVQVAMVRNLATAESKLLNFAHEFTNAGYNSLSAHYQKFGDIVLRTMLRDLERLSEARDLPPLLARAIGSLPQSGDDKLDNLLDEAIVKFQDRDPQTQKLGIERLWDGFERLKTLGDGDKNASAEMLLEQAAPEPAFQDVLRTEMMALTKLGNDFHIRHFERNKIELSSGAESDYLFHRLFALIYLLLRRAK